MTLDHSMSDLPEGFTGKGHNEAKFKKEKEMQEMYIKDYCKGEHNYWNYNSWKKLKKLPIGPKEWKECQLACADLNECETWLMSPNGCWLGTLNGNNTARMSCSSEHNARWWGQIKKKAHPKVVHWHTKKDLKW